MLVSPGMAPSRSRLSRTLLGGRRASCTLHATVATIIHGDLAGPNQLTIGSRLGPHSLGPGSYLLVLLARTGSGVSRPVTVALRVV